jgi:predicted nucleic acid-binding protein
LTRKYVVDASVILKWILGDERESDQEKAMQLLHAWVEGNVTISAPTLWQFEVGNVLGRVIPEEAPEKMNLILNLNIRSIALTDHICRLCFNWMKTKGVTFYDASYLAIAHDIQALLITADERFVKKIGKSDHLCLLKSIDL